MVRIRCVAAVVVVLVSTPPATAQIMNVDHIVPVVARTAGAGDPPTQWVTDVVVVNVYDEPLTVGMMYFPWGDDRVTDWDFEFPVVMDLDPQETRLLEDVLRIEFGYQENTKGALMVSCSQEDFPGNPADAKMMVTSRTYNTGSTSGTFGQTVLPADMYRGETYEPSYVLGARHDDRFRSNLGIMNVSPGTVTVRYRIRAADGDVLVEGSRTLEVFDGGQWSFSELGLPRTDGALRVEVWLDPADVTPDPCAVDWHNGFIAYVSKVDGNPLGTGDAEFLPAIPDDFPPPGWLCDD